MISVETHPSFDQAASALGPDAVYLGGGTIVMRALNYGELGADRIVRSTDPALGSIERMGERVRIGAGVTMRQIIGSSDLAFLAPVARQVGGPAVRNVATVGGNLFALHPYGDLTTALLALDGVVSVAGGGDQPLDQFLSGRTAFSGLVSAVTVAVPNGRDFRWRKVSRVKPKGVSVLSIAAWLPQQTGRVSQARVAFGAMAETPKRATQVERALEGASLDLAGVQAALEAVAQDLSPFDDALASAWYRQEVAPVHLRRTLLGEEVAS